MKGESVADMANEDSERPIPAPPNENPWWKNIWLKVTAVLTAFALMIANATSILSNARALPSEIQKTQDHFFNWYGDYAAWKGFWTNYPEGVVNMAEMKLSKEGFRLNIEESSEGSITGTIESRGICEDVPVFEQLLIEGEISSSHRAEIDVFEFIGGYRRNFARLELYRDGYIIEVSPLNDPAQIFPKESRIALAPLDLIRSDGHEALCGDKLAEVANEAREGARSPSEMVEN
jgi:hypothetical protein